MAFSSGAQRDLYYALEDSFGVPHSPLGVVQLRNTEDSISLARDSFVSDERRGDRGIHDMRLGNKQPAGDVSFELSYGAFDDFLVGALAADAEVSARGETVTLDADTGVLTGTDTTWVADGFEVGQLVTISGFNDAGNNGDFEITDVDETSMTITPTDNLVDVSVAENDINLEVKWVAPYTDLEVEVTADGTDDTFTRASGSWFDDGVRVGDKITVTGFTTESGNNVTARVTDLTATVMTVDASLTTEDVGDTGTFNTSAVEISKGTTVPSFVVEKEFSDIGEFQLYSGGIVNSMNVEISPNSMITGSFSMLFKDAENGQSSYHSSMKTVATNRPLDAFTGYIKEGGSDNAQASSLSISLDNGFERNFVLMQNTCPQMTSGKSNATGSVTLYFEDSVVYNKFVNETESSIEIRLGDDNDNAYVFRLPRIKYTSADTPVSSDAAIINTMNYQALDDSDESSNIIIRKQPA